MLPWWLRWVRNHSAAWKTWVQSLGQEDPLEKGMATHSSILAWRIPMDIGAWWPTVHGVTENPLDRKEIKPLNPKGNEPWLLIEELVLELKLQYFGHLMQRIDSLEKTLMLGKIESRRRRGWESMSWLDGIVGSMDISLSKFWEIVKDREACSVVHGVVKCQTRLSNWTTHKRNKKKRRWDELGHWDWHINTTMYAIEN